MKLQLHRGALRLATLYLAVMMCISLFFSGVIYQLSLQEINRGFNRPGFNTLFEQMPLRIGGSDAREYVRMQIIESYQDAKSRIIGKLALVNLFILFGSGGLSYYLALRTLRPIEEAQQAQNRFTADASHELRTPITAMKSEIEVALMNPKLSLNDTKALLASNVEELDKLTALSEGLLRLASTEQNTIQRKMVKLGSILSKARERTEHSANDKEISIVQKGDISTKVNIDQSGLTDAIVILLDNAIKYSPQKSTIHLTVKDLSKRVSIAVKDEGIGIKASELPHIFDRFYRADNARSRTDTGGYGLGLAIAKNIAEQHHGSISVSSKVGKGSTFTISLPK